ncbi:MAG TPA: hypothetical protein VFS34_01550 [Thermoanaerobaculia bacterium]|nr:hypothetical protein [Thermoanaerobaculia bacterium]
MPRMDAKLRAMLKELGDAINDSVSESDRVHETIERLREHGYRLFLNLDARIGIERDEDFAEGEDESVEMSPATAAAEFRIDFRDLRFLKSVGIDPTRKVRTRRARATVARRRATKTRDAR